jgi:hypothetical protein
MTITYTLDNDDGSQDVVALPSKFEVCRRCQGKGSHDGWEGGMTRDDMDEYGPEFMEDYMSGVYDRQCTVCKGVRVVEVVDRNRVLPELLARYDATEQELADCDAMQRSERWAEECFERRLMGLGPDYS